jgi:hypothetical protein
MRPIGTLTVGLCRFGAFGYERRRLRRKVPAQTAILAVVRILRAAARKDKRCRRKCGNSNISE